MISTPPTLLAWCSDDKNKINVIDLKTKQSYATVDGARINKTGKFHYLCLSLIQLYYLCIDNSWTHVKEIPNTKLLVSLRHNSNQSANLTIFDTSQNIKAKKIYSLGAIYGGQIH